MTAKGRSWLESMRRGLFISAAVLGTMASLFWLFTPVAIEEQIAQFSGESIGTVESTTVWISFYQAQGAWGLLVLLGFCLIYVLIAWLAVRERMLAAAGSTLAALTLVYLSGFSIGLAYVPAALAVVIGWGLWGLRSAFEPAPVTSPAGQAPSEPDDHAS